MSPQCQNCGEKFDRVRAFQEHKKVHELDNPWTDEDLLRSKYLDESRSMAELADEFGCSTATVKKWLDRFDISTRGHADGHKVRRTTFCHTLDGYEQARSGDVRVYIHRLAAVAWFGYDSVVDKLIHHKSNIPWDNRQSNLQPVTPAEHGQIHSEGGIDA